MRTNIIRAGATAAALLVAGCSAPDNAAETVPAAPAAETVTAPATPVQDGHAWAAELLYQADMEATPNVAVIFTNEANCGAALSPAGQGGCTLTLEDGSYLVTISPDLIGTLPGKHVFFHELAHTHVVTDECEAEHYAAQFDEYEMWSYPECAATVAGAEY